MADLPESVLLRDAAAKIIAWYRTNRRSLPWREEAEPYKVWISEIMLQQTRIETVIPYYRRFLEELPDVKALAAVDEDRLLKLWEGLGYYSRARNLRRAANQIMTEYGGTLPQSAAELKKLAGIGDYTAGAIASIACGQAEPAVDGNVLRVLSRLLTYREDVLQPKNRAALTAALREIYPSGEEAALLTEGLMELGETVCLPNGAPRCEGCPVRTLCRARQSGRAEAYPVRSAPKARKSEQRTVFLLRSGDRYAVRRRPEKGLLAGLWEFPNTDGTLKEAEALRLVNDLGCRAAEVTPCGQAKHIFSHIEWHMSGYSAECAAMPESFEWKTAEDILKNCSVAAAFRFYRNLIGPERQE